MFFRVSNRHKNGKDHRYFSIVENRRVAEGKHVQKTLLYLGEINDSQKAGWIRNIDIVGERSHRQLALFPDDREIPDGFKQGVQLRLSELQLHRPPNGAPAGWPATCGSNWNWEPSGSHDCPSAGKARTGFISFLAYCLQVTLKQRCKRHASGLTPRSVLEQLKAMQMIDVVIPTVDGRWLTMSRYTQPDKAQQLLLAKLQLELPPQPPPKITSEQFNSSCSEDL